MTPEPLCPGACRAVRFTLSADGEPGLLPRVLQTLARRDLTPSRLTVRLVEGLLHVDLLLRDAPPEDCHLVHGNLRQLVGVHHLRREDMVFR